MKTITNTDSIRKKYLRKLFADPGVDDAMPIFTRAMRIFRLGKSKSSKKSHRK